VKSNSFPDYNVKGAKKTNAPFSTLYNSYIANFYNVSIYLKADSIGYNWAKIIVIPPVNKSLPVARLGLYNIEGKIVTLEAGYAAGFQIFDSSDNILCECYLCEGLGTEADGISGVKNSITCNIYSGNYSGLSQPKYFEVLNAALTQFWVQSFRLTDVYANGYSIETVKSSELILGGDCTSHPRTADGYKKVGTSNLIASGSLFIENPYIIGNLSINTVLLKDFYRIKLTVITNSVKVLLANNVFYFRINKELGVGTHTWTAFINQENTINYFYLLYSEGFSYSYIDNISVKKISQPFGILVPAHATQPNIDAFGNTLTNP